MFKDVATVYRESVLCIPVPSIPVPNFFNEEYAIITNITWFSRKK
jgi:hypothetical protein